LNQLNRSMGMRDIYPFALTNRVVDKLAFVHRLCLDAAQPRSSMTRAAEARLSPVNV
jgi:hypothetical protein